ncbi:hypothetical protein [Candidatus Endoriftia persephone]|jgi:hypothetical protein|uniref:Uncharacterized protein n=1 Tax=Candidatus Endoriftia persephonae TaxID=393765 RepID=A0A9J6ZXD3_9GAMM|nr:hypothetical protein [Candidatus Endoriftia persephone]USF87410.1 hypothetical protein L0Y14_15020 [Candidatus Endoriftia persephone]
MVLCGFLLCRDYQSPHFSGKWGAESFVTQVAACLASLPKVAKLVSFSVKDESLGRLGRINPDGVFFWDLRRFRGVGGVGAKFQPHVWIRPIVISFPGFQSQGIITDVFGSF